MRRSASGPALVAAALAALALSGLVGGPVGGARADQAIAKDPDGDPHVVAGETLAV
jgi:hypothetical protein